MNTPDKLTRLVLAGLGFTAAVSQAIAGPLVPQDITVADYATTPTNGFNGGPFSWGTQAVGTLEDNETERTVALTAVASQVWDMEAFTLSGNMLSIVTGYNMSTGQDGWKPGDLFIKIGGAAPGPGTLTSSPSVIQNNMFPSGEGYSFAVDLSLTGGIVGTMSTNVYDLSLTSMLNTVNWDGFGSNPWTYASGAENTLTTGISYTTGRTASQVATATGVGALSNLKDGGAAASHNILNVDLSFLAGLVTPGTTVYFSYVMECGNDSLKGEYGGGFDRVPEGGTSAILLGFGLTGLSALRLIRRKK